MVAAPLYSVTERELLDAVTSDLVSLDRYASEPLSRCFTRIVETFERVGTRHIAHADDTHLVQLSLETDLDVVDPEGKSFPEVRLQYRRRSRSAIARTARQLLGAIPPARVLVLTPKGYRLTTLRNLEAKRFRLTNRPRLAAYKASSVANLSKYIVDAFGGQLFAIAARPSFSPPSAHEA